MIYGYTQVSTDGQSVDAQGRALRAARTGARNSEGRKCAMANGVKMGRKPKMTPHQQKEVLRRRDTGEPLRDIARTFNVGHSTISRLPT